MAARILLVDDDAALARLLTEYLQPMGFEVSLAATAAEGLRRVAAQAFDAVLLDVMLPDLDGFEVCRRIRAASDVPVLMLTARGQDEDRIVGLELGADDYLPKPFNPRELLARLCFPTVHPNLNYEFAKGYYGRVTDRLYGRVTRLFMTPLLRAMKSVLGPLPLLEYLDAFRYPLAGECSMTTDLVRINRIPSDWGLEVGVLAEVFRNCSQKRICQVELVENPDVLATLAGLRIASSGLRIARFTVGFALEVLGPADLDLEAAEARARAKLLRKHLDAIVLNGVETLGAAVARVFWLPRKGARFELPPMSKEAVARWLVSTIDHELAE